MKPPITPNAAGIPKPIERPRTVFKLSKEKKIVF
jgi:hypothetical protein